MEDDPLRVVGEDEVADARGQGVGMYADLAQRDLVACVRRGHEPLHREAGVQVWHLVGTGYRGGPHVVQQPRRRRGHLPTPAAAAVTASAVSGHARVAYLTGDGVGSSPELAVDDDPRAHARAGLEADEIAHGLRVAEPRLGNRLDAALVVEVDRQAEFILEQRRESDAAPARHVRDGDDATDLVHQPRHAHPECHYRAARLVPGHERAQQVDQRVDRALRVGERVERHGLTVFHRPVEAADTSDQPADLDHAPEPGSGARHELEHPRAPSPGASGVAETRLDDQPLVDQGRNTAGDGGLADPGALGEVDPGDGGSETHLAQ